MDKKINLAVLYGSRSVEHDVSIISAVQLMKHVDAQKYNVVPVYISQQGLWYTGDKLLDMAFYTRFDAAAVTQVWMEATKGSRTLWRMEKGLLGEKRRAAADIDVAIPVFHGMHGEDGTVQGLLELVDLPYSGPGVMGAALGMDKIAMRMAFKGAGIPSLDAVWFERGEYQSDADGVCARAEAAIEYPMFVKPANLGSSIGISRADDRAGLMEAIDIALHFDRRVIVETGLADNTEINCAAIGYGADVETSMCEQPLTSKEMLDFEDKYIGAGKTKGMQNMTRLIPAPIDEETTARIQEYTRQAYRLLDCRGVVRVDFIIDNTTGQLYLNEINTIPGSMAFYLWTPMGVSYAALIDRMVDCAMRSYADKHKNEHAFQSQILQNVRLDGGKNAGSKG